MNVFRAKGVPAFLLASRQSFKACASIYKNNRYTWCILANSSKTYDVTVTYPSSINAKPIVIQPQALERVANRALEKLDKSFHANRTKGIVTQV